MNPFNHKITRATRHTALILLVSFLLVSCGGGGNQPAANPSTSVVIASGVVTSAGGVVSDGSENTLVIIPPGAVTENTTITIRQTLTADGLPALTFESSVPTGLVQIILPDPDSPAPGGQQPLVGVSSLGASPAAGVFTPGISFTSDTKFECGVDSSRTWYRRCANFWKPNHIINGVYVNGEGNRLADRVVDMKLSPELKVAERRPAVLLASECEFLPLASSLCYGGKEPVLFVHGFLPTTGPLSENGFGGGGDTYNDFPQQLKTSITTKAVTLFEFRWVTAAKFEDVAQDLGIAIDQIAARTGKKVHVVAHSFGGVLVRTYLQGLASGAYQYSGNVASLTSLGTPHSGIFDGNTEHVSTYDQQTFWQGTHPGLGTTQTNNCKQLSCYQVGEPINFGEESYLGAANIDHKKFLAVAPEPGEITTRLFDTRHLLPYVPIQVLIGLAADMDASVIDTFFGDSVDVKGGDCLISYAGQRFAPSLMNAATTGQQLVNGMRFGDAMVTEHILGFPDDTRPGMTILMPNGDPERYGYRHAATNLLGLDILPGCRGDSLKMVGVNSTNASFHDGLERASFWIRHHPSTPSTPPVNIVVTGRIVDKQTGAGLGVVGTVMLRPWLAIGQTDVNGNFRIEVNQVIPVDNIEMVATVTGYQQGFQTALGAGSGGLVSLPNLGLIKTGSTTDMSVVLQRLAKLEVITTGDGNGNVTGQGIGCPAKCSVWVSTGSTLVLKAVAWRGSQFSGWSGCARVTGANGESCEALVGANGAIATATFTKLALPLPLEPFAPSVSIATALSQSSISFTWQDNASNESGFQIERKLGLGGIYTMIAQPLSSTGASSSASYQDMGLTADAQYCYRARAFNAGGYSSYTAESCATTFTPPPPPPPTTSTLNDTGITASQCYQAGSDILVACDSAGAMALNPAQDGMVGRDANAATNSATDGKLGFSFTSVPAVGVDPGGCVQDNVTGLMWEVKTADGGLRDWNKTYTNYDSTLSAQKYNFATGISSNPTQAEIDAPTNSIGFKNSVNAQGLCGFSDWRLPTADELQSIVDYGVGTIDTIWFPNTPGGGSYWSASPFVVPNTAWFVNFVNGGIGIVDGNVSSLVNYGRNFSLHVQLVRAGQSPILPRYTVSIDGQEVTDQKTGLIWRRCAEGMNWDGSTCAGAALTFTHEAALVRARDQAAGTAIAWRLPNVKELSSIIERSRAGPAIDQAAFPATPSNQFWSASPLLGNSSFAWRVQFIYGLVGGSFGNVASNRNGSFHVRLVRDAP